MTTILLSFLLLLSPSLSGGGAASAAELLTNEVAIHDAPKWLTAARVNKVVQKVQRMLEWDIRKVEVRWHSNESEFAAAHGLPVVRDGTAQILAVSKKSENTIHVGPRVDTTNFDGTFGHELAHVIVYQKYKTAIPVWLEEGLANYSAKNSTVDYKYLSTQPDVDVKAMGHPFGGKGPGPRFHYMASTALMEMIASKCDIHELLQLSVGEKLESYLDTFCGISDLNAEFRRFVKRKAGS
ncbi:MAG: hypothetical protein HY075_14040 [Deltaproteobacteria bacterium]|nr:hypothetical protein [Deltaproteobacteria bacterium]